MSEPLDNFLDTAILLFSNFRETVQVILQSLHKRLGFQLWMFTRVNGEDWIVLEAADYGYNVTAGDIFKWSDSFCSRMVEGKGPRVAFNAQQIKAYVEAPIGRQVEICAYIGIPLCNTDGTLFGTLCAIDPATQPESIKSEQEFIELQARLLTTILHYELKTHESNRRCERIQLEAELDTLTGVYNRKGWDRLFHEEEERCLQLGLSASVLVVDLDDLKWTNDHLGHEAGDHLIHDVAKCLLQNIRSEDVLARIGGDEFAILIIDTNLELTQQVVQRIQDELERNNLKASVGWSIRMHQSTLFKTFIEADKIMYQNKSKRKNHD